MLNLMTLSHYLRPTTVQFSTYFMILLPQQNQHLSKKVHSSDSNTKILFSNPFFCYRPPSTKRGVGCSACLARKDFTASSWTPPEKMAKTCPYSFIQATVASCQQYKAQERFHEVIIWVELFVLSLLTRFLYFYLDCLFCGIKSLVNKQIVEFTPCLLV